MKNTATILIVLATLITSCKDPFLDTQFIEKTNANLELSNAEFLKKHTERYASWIELLKYANLYNALNDASSNSTVFAPNNEAVANFLQWKGVQTVEELPQDYVRSVAQIHILKGILKDNDFIRYVDAGSVPIQTLFESYLTTSYGFRNLDLDDQFLDDVVLEDSLSIYLNNQAKVSNLGRADTTANGRVYTLEDVIRPLTETITEVLRTYKEYNIFVEAAEKTGYDKIVSVIADTVMNLDGSISVTDIRFTCFAVPDQVYNEAGIQSFDNLVTYLNAGSDYENPENALYQYVSYHFLKKSYKKADLSKFKEEGEVLIFDTNFTGNVITVQSDDGTLKINDIATIVRSNIQSRNGLIHKIDHVLPVYEPEPIRVAWDFNNMPDIESFVNAYGASKNLGELFFTPTTNKEYQVDLSEDKREGNFGTISSFEYKFTATKTSTRSWRRVGFFKCSYFSSKIKDVNKYGAYMDNLFTLNLGFAGSITLKTPTIIKGKYKVIIYYAGSPGLKTYYPQGSNTRFNMDDYQKSIFMWKGIPASFIDEEKRANVNANGIASDVLWEEITFEESGVHTFKATMMDINAKTSGSYRQMWDYLEFIPIK